MKMKKNNLKKYCFALDLIDEKDKIDSYIEYHKKVWPEIYNSIRDSGVKKLEIFQIQNRLFMILEASEKFSLDNKAQMDAKIYCSKMGKTDVEISKINTWFT